MSDILLKEGIESLKEGKRAKARAMLIRALRVNPRDAQAWLWLAATLERDEERLFCLERALEIDPNVPAARRALEGLRHKRAGVARTNPPQALQGRPERGGIHPINPNPTREHDQSPSGRRSSSEPVTVAAPSNLQNLTRLAAMDISSGKSRKAVIDQLLARGVTSSVAKRIVREAGHGGSGDEKQRIKIRMIRGLLIALAGVGATVIGYLLSAETGRAYLLFYGMILGGLFDFIVGFMGWIRTSAGLR